MPLWVCGMHTVDLQHGFGTLVLCWDYYYCSCWVDTGSKLSTTQHNPALTLLSFSVHCDEWWRLPAVLLGLPY